MVPGSTRVSALLAASLALLVVVRIVPLPDVLYGGDVVLSGNDPYAYRHAVDQFLAGHGSPWELPEGVARGEPLLVTTLWLGTVLLGGSEGAADLVLAWYPVVAAVGTGLIVYLLGTRASDDSRVGLAAVVIVAVTPAHAYRSSVGFADHHAFDVFWLTLTAYALLVLLTSDRRDRTTWAVAALFGVGVAGQLLAWSAGPLLVAPVGVVVALYGALADSESCRPHTRLEPVVLGLGLGAVLVVGAHVLLGWHSVAIPATGVFLFVGSLAIWSVTTGYDRHTGGWPAAHWLIGVAVLLVGAVAAAILGGPALADALASGLDFLFRDSAIGEMSTLVEDYGPVFGPLIILGFGPFLALPAVYVGLRDDRRTGSVGWLLLIVYAGWFAALTLLQRRFGSELAPFLAVLGGLGLVVLLAWLGVVRLPPQMGSAEETDRRREPDPPVAVPDRTRLALLVGAGAVLVGSGTLYTSLINARITIDSRAYRAAQWMDGYADEREWTYPANYVFSQWGRNRMYNYVVNGEARSYAFAQDNYEPFLFSSAPREWYEALDGRVGFVVTSDLEAVDDVPEFQLQARLHENLGSATARTPGLAHYRAVYSAPDGSHRVFTLVEGARLLGHTDADTVRVSTDVSIPGVSFEYVRTDEPGPTGRFILIVAHPGTYQVGDREVTVSERAVREGAWVEIE